MIKNLKGIKFWHISHRFIDIKKEANKYAKELNGEIEKVKINNLHMSLDENNEIGDYLFLLKDGRILASFNCCIMVLEDVKEVDFEWIFDFIKNLNEEAYKAHPLIIKDYSKRVWQKKEDALSIWS